MLWSIAWRNIWRNKVRSLIILSAIILGITAGTFIWAFYKGMANQRIYSAIKSEVSNIQIHHQKYLENSDSKFSINLDSTKKGMLSEFSQFSDYSERVISLSMITTARSSKGVKIYGIDPVAEMKVTNIYSKIKSGSYFGKEVKRNPIVISARLAEKLGVKLNSKVFLTLQQTDGTLTRSAFKIVGLYTTSNSAFDELNVFVQKPVMQKLMGIGTNQIHEIAFFLKPNLNTDSIAVQLKKKFAGFDIKTWKQIMPEVGLIEDTMDVSMVFFMMIILLGLLFGIINTMLMAILERTKELGMLMAVGMTKFRVFYMIILETVMLSLTGGIFGVLLASILSILFAHIGIDLSAWSEGYKALGYDTLIYPVMNWKIVLNVTFMVTVTGVFAAIYPSIKALKLKPVEAIHMDN